MRGILATSRWPIVQLALVICMPLCCCRVGAIIAMLPGGGSAADVVAMESGSCAGCCHPDSRAPGERDAPFGDDQPVPGLCTGSCCLKGTTPDRDDGVPPQALLAGLLPAQIIESAHPGPQRWERLPIDPGGIRCDSLLRQRCALLI